MRITLTVTALVAAFLVSPLMAAPAGAAVVSCAGHRATIVGTAGNDHINGTPGDDVIAALGGNDVVHGGGGNDIICGGDGADTLWGDSGNDRLYGGRNDVFVGEDGLESDGDYLVGGSGNDRLVAGDDRRGYSDPQCECFEDELSWHSSTHGVHVDIANGTADGDGHDTFDGHDVWILGSLFSDVIDGSPAADVIYTFDGNDVVRSGAGDDYIQTDPFSGVGSHGGADRVWAGPGNDNVLTGYGPDIVHGGLGNDVIGDNASPPYSADQFFGEAGDDHISDSVIRTSAPQRLSGGTGTDRLDVNVGVRYGIGRPASWNMATGAMVAHSAYGDIHATMDGFEIASIGTWNWTVVGTDGPDTLVTQSHTVFDALGGDDTFTGSAYSDTFNGGPGTDHSLGMGDGNDTCISVEIFDVNDCENVTP